MDAADVVILSGPPGAGKTTTARALATGLPRAAHLHADDFWHRIVTGAIPPYLPESDAQNRTVVGALAAAAAVYAHGGFTTVVDGVLGPWMLGPLLAPMSGLRVHYAVLRASRDEALRRASDRGGDALVDPTPVLALWDQFAVLRDHEAHVIDNDGQAPEQTVDAVRHGVGSGALLLDAGIR